MNHETTIGKIAILREQFSNERRQMIPLSEVIPLINTAVEVAVAKALTDISSEPVGIKSEPVSGVKVNNLWYDPETGELVFNTE